MNHRILDAIEFATFAHRHQVRLDCLKTPYVAHCIQVSQLCSIVTDDADILIAAILHDTIEDCGVTYGEICNIFYFRAADLVQEMTDDKSLPKDVRKQLQIVSKPSQDAWIIKTADKIANISDLPYTNWPIDRKMKYLEWADKVVLRDDNECKLKELYFMRSKEVAEILQRCYNSYII